VRDEAPAPAGSSSSSSSETVRVLSWCAEKVAGIDDSPAAAAGAGAGVVAAGLERALHFIGQEMGFGEEHARRSGISRAVGAALWPAVAAAITFRWLSGAALDDDAVDALCAAEGVAASFGLVPPPSASTDQQQHQQGGSVQAESSLPAAAAAAVAVELGWPGGALGPIEAAALEREASEADGRRSAALAEARAIILEGESDRATLRTACGGKWGKSSSSSSKYSSRRWVRGQAGTGLGSGDECGVVSEEVGLYKLVELSLPIVRKRLVSTLEPIT
jgi:hypothetical protein